MFHDIKHRLAVATASAGLFFAAKGVAAPDTQPAVPPASASLPDADAKTAEADDDPSVDKLSAELKLLLTTETKSRDLDDAPRRETIRRSVGASPEKSRGGADSIEVAIHLKAGADEKSIGGPGIAVHFRQGDTLYASIDVGELKRVAAEEQVESIGAMLPRHTPKIPTEDQQPASTPPRPLSRDAATPGAFDHQGLTGKGVIVGICDTGIDWRHPDFIRPAGTSRILYLYDCFDDSYQESNGAIGSKPPYHDTEGNPIGTLYTNEQINAALQGKGTVNSLDEVGHGTACTGTAAGNRSGDISGVAPEADIIFAKVLSNKRSKFNMPYMGEKWVIQTAAKLNKPVAMSLSFGGHDTPHDGSDAEEQLIDNLVGAGKPGAAIFISAGNEARSSVHGTQRFGPVREGQADSVSPPIEMIVHEETSFVAYFDHRDDWQLEIDGKDKFFLAGDGKGRWLNIFRSPTGVGLSASWNKSMTVPEDPADFFHKNIKGVIGKKIDSLFVILPPGRYFLYGQARSANVTNGRFDIYLTDPDSNAAELGYGATRKGIVGSPGNADAAITVASYDFRSDWENADGVHVYYNMELGKISAYSSLGFRRDGVIKPDLAAPGEYMLSAAAKDSEMAAPRKGHPNRITKDGLHLAWSGTSASSPYCAGVAALMLQKNPTLDAAQIKKILTESADHSLETTGAVPNEEWGYGRLNPEKALQDTPGPDVSSSHTETTAPAKAEVKDPIQQLQGTWKVLSADRPGRKPMSADEVEKMSVVIAGNKLALSNGDRKAESVFMTLDPSKTPAWMDLKETSDSPTSIPGIYKLQGDTLQLCWNKKPYGSRPRSFTDFGDQPDGEFFVLKLKLQ